MRIPFGQCRIEGVLTWPREQHALRRRFGRRDLTQHGDGAIEVRIQDEHRLRTLGDDQRMVTRRTGIVDGRAGESVRVE
ncbi:Uncharacterised protein [Mycobacteroides abscessus subsp. massiliense]|nr:Uncharacterised protein [Mycobacteroides abscessus subsp. massiliense]